MIIQQGFDNLLESHQTVVIQPSLRGRSQTASKNFGYIFSIWDWIFKTAYKPQKSDVIVYGIGENETAAYQGLYGVYILPLIGIWRLIVRNFPIFSKKRITKRGYSLAGILWRETAAAPVNVEE